MNMCVWLSVCLSVCLHVNMSVCRSRTSPNFCAHCLWPCLASPLPWRRCDTLYTSGLWMTLRFHIMGAMMRLVHAHNDNSKSVPPKVTIWNSNRKSHLTSQTEPLACCFDERSARNCFRVSFCFDHRQFNGVVVALNYPHSKLYNIDSHQPFLNDNDQVFVVVCAPGDEVCSLRFLV